MIWFASFFFSTLRSCLLCPRARAAGTSWPGQLVAGLVDIQLREISKDSNSRGEDWDRTEGSAHQSSFWGGFNEDPH